MSKNKITTEVEKLNTISEFNGSNWSSINPEYAARMRLQNQFKSGIDIAKYTASLMRKDMDAYDSDTNAYTHVNMRWIFNWARNSCKISNWSQADIQIKNLTK